MKRPDLTESLAGRGLVRPVGEEMVRPVARRLARLAGWRFRETAGHVHGQMWGDWLGQTYWMGN